jgi:hypothetical protein
MKPLVSEYAQCAQHAGDTKELGEILQLLRAA